MKTLIAIVISLFAANAMAQTSAACEAKAVSKDGKPLTGAAKNSFVTKCMADAK